MGSPTSCRRQVGCRSFWVRSIAMAWHGSLGLGRIRRTGWVEGAAATHIWPAPLECLLLPPRLAAAGWDPPFALERGTNGLSMESFRFAVRKQYTSHLCRRAAPPVAAPGTPTTGASGRYGGRVNNSPRGGGDKEQEQAQAQMQAHGGCEAGPAPMHVDGVAEPAAAADPPAGSIGDAPEAADARPREGEQQREQPKSGAPPPSLPQEFGFPHLVS